MSNRYAQRVFSEHPIAMWSFDDKVGYIDLLTSAERDVADWALDNMDVSIYSGLEKPSTPFTSYNSLVLSPTNELLLEMEATSDTLWTSGDIKADVPVSASMFLFVYANSIDYVDFGSTDGVSYDTTRTYFPEIAQDVWVKVSHFNMLYGKLYIKIVFKPDYSLSEYEYLLNGLTVGQYSESISSDSLGIDPYVPAGTEAVIVDGALPATVAWYEEKSSGITERSMFHVVEGNEFLSYNTAMPMVYGSNYLTRLRPIAGEDEGTFPSLVFDGCGMFTDQGRYDTFTLEFWMRIGGGTLTPRKLVGPAIDGNEDGLFVCGSIFTLTIGDKRASYSVGRLGDPMLIHIVYTPAALSLLINGETVLEINIDPATLDMPDETNQWLGFYSYEDIGPIEIDVVSIFGYAIPGAMAKRRFVWGQGVGDISLINYQYQGDGVYANYASSGAVNSVSYPDDSTWSAGSLDNLTVKRNKLSYNQPKEPVTVLASHTKQEWLDDLSTYSAAYLVAETTDDTLPTWALSPGHIFSYCPNSEYEEEVNYTLFSDPTLFCKDVSGFSISFRSGRVDGLGDFYGPDQSATDFASTEAFLETFGVGTKDYLSTIVDDQGNETELTIGEAGDFTSVYPLFRINSRANPNKFVLSYLLLGAEYQFVQTIYVNTATGIVERTANSKPVFYYNDSLTFKFEGLNASSEAKSMLKNIQDLEIILGSDLNTSSSVEFHSFCLFNKRWYNENISPLIGETVENSGDYYPLYTLATGSEFPATSSAALYSGDVETGLPEPTDASALLLNQFYKKQFFTNYSYFVTEKFGDFYEDYGVKGSFEDYVPLASLAGVVKDIEGNDSMAVDTLQYNISYPAPEYESPDTPDTWTYGELLAFYEGLTLSYLYMGVYSGYPTYEDLMNNTSLLDISDSTITIDTSGEFVRTYISLQDSTNSLKQANEFDTITAATNTNTVYFQVFDDFEDHLFEIYDGAILIPPRSRGVDKLSLGFHIEYSVPGVLTYPVEIKSLELAAFAKNRIGFTPVKSTTGKDVYPFVHNGVYHDHAAYNPFKIDKRGLPYLYLGSESGFTPMGLTQEGWSKGLEMYMPETKDTLYRLDNVQFWIRKNNLFSEQEKVILELTWDNNMIYFTSQSFQDDKTRGIIRAYSSGGVPYLGGKFIQNGNIVTAPVIDMSQWHTIAYAFENDGLDLTGNMGKMRFYPGYSYNNVSYFSTKASLGTSQINYRSWTDVLAELWSYWRDLDLTWEQIGIEGLALVKAKELSQIVYRTYIGTEQISVEGPSALRFGQDGIASYPASSWSTTTAIPV